MIRRTVVMLVLMLAVALPAAPAEAQKKRLAMGCTQAASSHYAYCVGASKAINLAVPDVDVSVVETGATVDNMKRMLKGSLDYGLVTPEQVYLGWKGEENWKDTPYPDIRVIWLYTVSANYIVMREETGAKGLQDLAGKKFNPGVSTGLEHQKAAFKGTTDDIPKLTVEASQSPLHAGAIKYFPERGLKIPDHLIPAEAK